MVSIIAAVTRGDSSFFFGLCQCRSIEDDYFLSFCKDEKMLHQTPVRILVFLTVLFLVIKHTYLIKKNSKNQFYEKLQVKTEFTSKV